MLETTLPNTVNISVIMNVFNVKREPPLLAFKGATLNNQRIKL